MLAKPRWNAGSRSSPWDAIERHGFRQLAVDPRRNMTDAAEPATRCFLMRVKDLSDETGIEPEVGVADDALAHPYTAVEPGRRHRRDTTRELGLADVAQVRPAPRPASSSGPAHGRLQ